MGVNMVNRLFAMVFVFGLFYCISSADAHGQTGQSCITWVYCSWYSFDSGCVPPPPPGATNCRSNGPWSQVCDVTTNQCPPVAAADEACPTCGKGKLEAGRPISLATGNTYIQQTDIRIPGLSNGLTLVRTWNSKWPSTQSGFKVGLFGPNWRSTFEERVFVGSDNFMKYSRGDGSFWSFGYSGSAGGAPTYGVAAPANVVATLVYGSSYWTITFQNGEKRLFSLTSGWLTAIIDRNGNTTQLSYDALNRLVTVTDPASRHLYFTYATSSSYLVTGISSDVGISLSYAYDAQGRLTQVTNPDLTTLSFAYNSQSLITSVTDSNGKILESHTYDSQGRGLTSSRANGAAAVTISYPNQ